MVAKMLSFSVPPAIGGASHRSGLSWGSTNVAATKGHEARKSIYFVYSGYFRNFNWQISIMWPQNAATLVQGQLDKAFGS
jgi:hypothetical protein